MRLIVLPLCACGLVSTMTAAMPAPMPTSPDAMLPGYTQPAQRWTTVEEAMTDLHCGDRIEQVREAAGQPKLDRETASAEKPLIIAAVDKRIDGCAVIQMKGNVNDLRPLPPPAEGRAELLPAR